MSVRIGRAAILSAIANWRSALFSIDGVNIVGRGRDCINVYVEQPTVNRLKVIPPVVDGVPVNVLMSGKLRPHQSRHDKCRPVMGGYRIASPIGGGLVAWGTFARAVTDSQNGEPLGLSVNHLLYVADQGCNPEAPWDACWRGIPNNPVYQPHSPPPAENLIGHSIRGVPIALVPSGTAMGDAPINLVDAAVFRPTSPDLLSNLVDGAGAPKGAIAADFGMVGRRFSATDPQGTYDELPVETLDASVWVGPYGYPPTNNIGYFEEQIIFRGAGIGGSSGSIYLTPDNYTLALHYAGGDYISVGNSPFNVERLLGISLGEVAPPSFTLEIYATECGGSDKQPCTSPAPGTYKYAGEPPYAVQTVTANAFYGFVFAYWVLDGKNVGSLNPINVTMDGDHTLVAVFSSAFTTLTVSVPAGGGTTRNPPPGTWNVMLDEPFVTEADPDSGRFFDYWKFDEKKISLNPIQYTIKHNHVLEAYFGKLFRLYVTSYGGGGTSPPEGHHYHPEGTYVSLIANPDVGYDFYRWVIDQEQYSYSKQVMVLMDQNHHYHAEFRPNPKISVGSTEGVPFEMRRKEMF